MLLLPQCFKKNSLHHPLFFASVGRLFLGGLDLRSQPSINLLIIAAAIAAAAAAAAAAAIAVVVVVARRSEAR